MNGAQTMGDITEPIPRNMAVVRVGVRRKHYNFGNKGGRPTKYNAEVAAEMCERIVAGEDGTPETPEQICLDDHMPSSWTFYKWQREHEEFSRDVAIAREAGCHSHASRAMREAQKCYDNPDKDRAAAVREASKVVMWYTARYAPGTFAEKVNVHHDGTVKHELDVGDRVEKAILKAAEQRKQLSEGEESPGMRDITATAKVEPEPTG